MELSYFGAKVLHPAAIAPAVAKGIPLLVKNTFNPKAPGTLISRAGKNGDHLAKGITSIAGLNLLTLRGLSMVGVPGNAERLFRALASRGVSVILISKLLPSTPSVLPSGTRTRRRPLRQYDRNFD